MTETRRTPFRDKLRTFADIHRATQEDWIISLFQKLCVSVQSVDWTSPQFDETKLTVAQNLVCVDKCYKRWKEDSASLGLYNVRPQKAHTLQASSAPQAVNPSLKGSSLSPPLFGSSGLLKKIEGIDIVDTDDSNMNSYNQDSLLYDTSQKSSTSPPPQQAIWTAPDPTRAKYDLKKKHVEIINFTIESKFKAIKAVVDRTARGIQERRYGLLV
jgi:hypothetical protein